MSTTAHHFYALFLEGSTTALIHMADSGGLTSKQKILVEGIKRGAAEGEKGFFAEVSFSLES
jgi:hypothetical protein